MDKLRYRQEVQAYRIVRRNIIKIVNAIPFNNMSKLTYEALINSNVTQAQIKDMYKEIYTTLGNPQYKRIKRSIKAELDFETIIANWLNSNMGLRIVSVHQTLIDAIVAVIAQGYQDNLSVEDITRNLQKKFGWYKSQALRIARTETTTATNYATVVAAQNSDFVLEKTWISVQDNRTRIKPYDHLTLNGVVQDIDKPYYVGGNDYLMYPGDPKGQASDIINCRCKIVITLKTDKDGLPIRKQTKY